MADLEPNDLTARVFAYGSNMCSGRFRDYGVHPLRSGRPAILRSHRLCFNKRSTKDGSGKANVERNEGTDVWGVLYDIPEHELPGLIRKEVGYTPGCMPVELTASLILDAWVLFASKPEQTVLHPYSWYLRFLIEGAIEHHLEDEYIEILRAIHATEDPDRERDRSKRELQCAQD